MKRFTSIVMMLTAMVFLLSSCNCYKKMLKNIDQVEASCSPEVLTLKGATVTADISVKFPAKYFHKKAVLKITPVLVFEGGEVAGTPKFLQGRSVKDNYTSISKGGGSYEQTVSFPYDSRMNLATLELRIESKCAKGSKSVEFLPMAAIPVASGVSAVQNLVKVTQGLELMADNFKRVTSISKEADIMYLINSSNVRNAQLTSDQVKMFEDFVTENSNKDRVALGAVYSKGYASPDGPVKFNDKLAKKRSVAGEKAVRKQLKSVEDVRYDMASYGEDWDGFKKLVQASNIEDKDVILQVLSMYTSPADRDQQIQNMAQVFDVLKKEILPQLRRTQLVATADVTGYTDAELKSALMSKLNELKLEELMYAATLVSDNASKAKAYQTAATKFNDARAYNNLGVVLAKQGKLADAKRAVEKAASIKSSAQIVNNLGVIALAQNDLSAAKRYLASTNYTGKYLLALKEGNYTEAVKGLKGYNLAVAQVCNGNLSAAKSALASLECKCPSIDYLKAIISMKEGDTKSAVANLKVACKKNDKFKAKAENNVDFAKLFGTDEFLAL